VDLFEPFRRAFAAAATSQTHRPWRPQALADTTGYEVLAAEFAGCSFERGLYGLHDARSGPVARGLIAEAFPEFADHVVPFGSDWLGRQFAIDLRRVLNGEPAVLMLEPGTGEALEIPCDLVSFHNLELLEYRDAALASDFFDEWARANAEQVPVSADHCVGYRVPLFLGGSDTLENLVLVDLEVYWSICTQLRRGTVSLRPGETITSVVRATNPT